MLAIGVCLSVSHSLSGAETRIERDLEYARVESGPLLLDLYLPEATRPPLVVWIHGGAWRSGSKDRVPVLPLVSKGYAVASVEYRLSPVAPFPAQIHDIKAAIRFLRAHQRRYGYDASRVGIAGSSAGGHLVALVGASNSHSQLEGTVGEHLDQSSDVQAVIDLYGPTNFLTILQQSTPHGLGVRIPALQLLLRGQPDDKPDLARLASPVFHVDPGDPPLLMIHGDQDPQVPINQSHELHGKYKAANLTVRFEVIHGGAHGGKEFYDEDRISLMQTFLDQHLKGNSQLR